MIAILVRALLDQPYMKNAKGNVLTRWPESWPRRVAITGASGFVGQHLTRTLRDEQLEVIPVSRSSDGHRQPGLVVVPDYLDPQRMTEAFAGVGVVVHLAARAHQKDTANAAAVFEVANVQTTLVVSEACRAAGVKRLIFLSSIGVHGNRTDTRPFTETDTPHPEETYAISKLKAEQVLADRLGNAATDYVILRPPLVYGPGCPGNFRSLLSLVAKAPVIPLGLLQAPRRFIHVRNLVEAIKVAMTHPDVSRRTFVLGDARDVSVSEIVHRAAEVMGRQRSRIWNVSPGVLEWLARTAGLGSAYAKLAAPLQVDASAFSLLTGWSPPIDPTEGIIETALHFADNPTAAAVLEQRPR